MASQQREETVALCAHAALQESASQLSQARLEISALRESKKAALDLDTALRAAGATESYRLRALLDSLNRQWPAPIDPSARLPTEMDEAVKHAHAMCDRYREQALASAAQLTELMSGQMPAPMQFRIPQMSTPPSWPPSQQPSPFVHALYDVVSNDDITTCAWTADGDAFCITDVAIFAQEMSSAAYSHLMYSTSWASFCHRLRNYGFETDMWYGSGPVFAHENFKRGGVDRLPLVKMRNWAEAIARHA